MYHDRFGHDDRIVDEKSERDDEGGERHLVETNVEESHDHQRHDNGHRNERSDDQAGAQAEENQHDRDHDGHGLQQIADEGIYFLRDVAGLEINDVEIYADRVDRLQSLLQFPDRLAEVDDVAAFAQADGQHQRRLAVEFDAGSGRIDIAAFDFGHVPKVEEILFARQFDDRFPELLYRLKVSARFQHNLFVIGKDLAAGVNDVARVENGFELRRRYAEL